IEGLELPGVHTLRTLPDADALRAMVDHGARRAVVLGAGFIGLEAAEAFRTRGLEVDLVDLAPHVLPVLDDELASLLADERAARGVRTNVGVAAERVEATAQEPTALAVSLSVGTVLPTDVVVLSVGVSPDSGLAATAGLDLGAGGAILVDEQQRTSDPHI